MMDPLTKRIFISVIVLVLLLFQLSLVKPFASIFSNESSCMASLGQYHGHKYTSRQTVSQGRCLVESKWMRVMQHQVNLARGETDFRRHVSIYELIISYVV